MLQWWCGGGGLWVFGRREERERGREVKKERQTVNKSV
jgi:hypothetical protein